MTTLLLAGGGTGGHLMPALAIADAVRRAHPEWQVVLVGARRGVEAGVLPRRTFRYHLLPAEPIYRRQWWRNLRWPALAIRLVREAGRVVDRERPWVVLGTGGYASGPVVWLAARRGIPTAIFEADARPGLTSRWLSRVVREVYLGVPEAEKGLRPGRGTRVVVTGAPILPPDRSAAERGRSRFGVDASRPVVLVTGGSQGALPLNEAVAEWIRAAGGGGGRAEAAEGGPPQVIWATGPGTYERFRDLHRPPAVHVVDFLDPIGDAYAVADLAITRAGMLTIAELCAWGLPGILVPLPTAAADHQSHNAWVMAEAGAAIHLPQTDLTPARLAAEVGRLLADPARLGELAARARRRGRPQASAEIVGRLEGLIAAG